MRNDSDDDNHNTHGILPRSWLGLKEAGGRAFQRGKYEEALDLYRMALRPEYECASTSDRQIILSNIVACRLKIGGEAQAAAAVNDAKQCVALNPQWSKGHVRLASAYSALGRSNDACNALQTALRLDPTGNPTARQMLLRELRRERGASANNAPDPSVDENNDDDGPPPPVNPSYVPPPNTSSGRGGNRDGIQVDIDDRWTLQDRLKFYRDQVLTWYRGQTTDVRHIILVGMVFFAICIAFGLQNTFQPIDTRPTRGNYGEGNAYEQFYRQRRASSSSSSSYYYDDPHGTHTRQTYAQHHNRNNYDHGTNHDDYYYGGQRSSYGYGGNAWRDSLPNIIRFSGIALFCYFSGLNPLHVLMTMNVGGGRRNRLFGRGFGGGFGGYGGPFRRRRRPGGFYW